MRHRPAATAAATLCLSVAGLGALLGLAPRPPRSTIAPDPLPAVQFAGHASAIGEARYVYLTDEASWNKLWAEHTGAPAAAGPPTRHATPKVDFSRYAVVGAFNGVGTNTDGLLVVAVHAAADAVRFRVETSSFQTASLGPGPDRGVRTCCFGLWVIEKTDKPVIIERPAPHLKNEPLRWQEAHRFEVK